MQRNVELLLGYGLTLPPQRICSLGKLGVCSLQVRRQGRDMQMVGQIGHQLLEDGGTAELGVSLYSRSTAPKDGGLVSKTNGSG